MGTFGGQQGPIYFMAGNGTRIERISPDGTGHSVVVPHDVQIGGHRYRGPWDPSISADGRTLAFDMTGPTPARLLMRADVAGPEDIRVLNMGSGEIEGISPTWAPDGEHIAYVRHTTLPGNIGSQELWISDKNGARRALEAPTTPGGMMIDDPEWSPNGRWIVCNLRSAPAPELEGLILVDTSDPSNFWTIDKEAALSPAPSWHPDSSKIVYRGGAGIHVLQLDDQGQAIGKTRLDTGLASGPVFAPSNDAGFEGDTILISDHASGVGVLYVIRDNALPKQLVAGQMASWGIAPRPVARGPLRIAREVLDALRQPDPIARIRRLLGWQ